MAWLGSRAALLGARVPPSARRVLTLLGSGGSTNCPGYVWLRKRLGLRSLVSPATESCKTGVLWCCLFSVRFVVSQAIERIPKSILSDG